MSAFSVLPNGLIVDRYGRPIPPFLLGFSVSPTGVAIDPYGRPIPVPPQVIASPQVVAGRPLGGVQPLPQLQVVTPVPPVTVPQSVSALPFPPTVQIEYCLVLVYGGDLLFMCDPNSGRSVFAFATIRSSSTQDVIRAQQNAIANSYQFNAQPPCNGINTFQFVHNNKMYNVDVWKLPANYRLSTRVALTSVPIQHVVSDSTVANIGRKTNMVLMEAVRQRYIR